MSERPEIVEHLAGKLRAARKARGLSLDAVASLSGVSKSMVSQIERGESSPTVAVLWNLTQALHLDFAGLMAGPGGGIDVIRSDAAPVIARRGDGVRIRILSPPESVGHHEVYDIVFDAGGALDSQAHAAGCREHLTVIEGRVSVVSGDDRVEIGPGDTARYAADRTHRLASAAGARAILIVQGG